MWLNRPVFTDPDLQAKFWQRGYARYDFMSPEAAGRILDELTSHAQRLGVEFKSQSDLLPDSYLPDLADNKEYRAFVADLLRRACSDQVSRLLPDYRIMHATLYIKPPGASELQLHNDFHMQASVDRTTVTAWCALTPATRATGALQFVPGSHQIMPTPVTVGKSPPHANALETLKKLLIVEELNPGQAIFFDQSVLHASMPNPSDETRIGALLGLLPKDSVSAYHVADQNDPESINVLKADTEERLRFRTDEMYSGQADLEILDRYEYSGHELSEDQFMAFLANADAIRDGDTTFDEVSSAVDQGLTRPVSLARPMKEVFTDPVDQATFNAQGYVKKRLISREEAADLLAKVKAMSPDDGYDPRTGGVGQTYHMTELDSNLAYKQQVRELTERHFGSLIEDLFTDYRILTSTLFVKPPGSGAAHQHTDWNVQEDNAWPTMFIWCPLDDVGEANGPLRVLRGSHGVLDFIHASASRPPYAETDEVLEPHFEPVTVEAGECILFDASMLHASHDNRTDEPRFALRIACIPKHRRGVMFNSDPDDPEVLQMYAMEGEDIMQHTGADLVAGNLKTELLRKIHVPNNPMTGEEILAIVAQGDRIRAGEATMESVLKDYRVAHPQPQPQPAPPSLAQTQRSVPVRIVRKIGRVVRNRLKIKSYT